MLEVSTFSRGELQVYPTEAGNGHRTGLSVTTAGQTGVLADLYDAHGGLLAAGTSVLDLRNEPAGTYYLRVYNPAGAGTAALPFMLTITAPTAGNVQPVPERSTLDGGDGNDILVAGTVPYSLDRLYGDGGTNHYVGEGVEIKDAPSLNNPLVMGPATEYVFDLQPFQFADQVVTFADPALALSVAQGVGPARHPGGGRATARRPPHPGQRACRADAALRRRARDQHPQRAAVRDEPEPARPEQQCAQLRCRREFPEFADQPA